MDWHDSVRVQGTIENINVQEGKIKSISARVTTLVADVGLQDLQGNKVGENKLRL
jgi:hypothetical protein